MRYLIKQYPALLLAFLLLCTQLTAFAADKDFPAQPNPPRLVNDFAGFLNTEEQAALEQKLQLYADSTSNQIAFVSVQSIGDYEIADYTVQLFNRWHIGAKKNNNGILLLAARDERKIWISTGYGLEGVLPDGLLGQIIRSKIQPAFKQAAFYQGLDQGTDAIIDAIKGEYKADANTKSQPKSLPTALIILVLIVFLVATTSGRGGGGGGMLGNAGWIAASMLSNRSSGSGWGGGSSGGFGGFGGGSSGGGGAGGSW